MKIEILKNKIIIKRNNDKKIYNESILYFKIKEKLNKKGFDLIKKLIHKDGHMMGGPGVYYLRDRNWNFCFIDNEYQIRSLQENYNNNEDTILFKHNFDRG